MPHINKKYWLFVLLLMATVSKLYAQAPPPYGSSIPLNYVRTWEVLAPVQNNGDLEALSPQLARQTTQYLDGLGRPLQTVAKQGSYDAVNDKYYDVVSPLVYDEMGKEQYKYLPYVSLPNGGEINPDNGGFKYEPFNQQQYFYSDGNAQSPVLNQGETFYYGKTDYEASPLNRPLKTLSPGDSWVGNNVGIGLQYLINTSAEHVKIWDVPSYNDYRIKGDYDGGKLYKTVTTDERGHKVIEYKDKEGKVILKKVQAANDGALGADYAGWLCTYYVYDDFNQLRLVIPPKAVQQLYQSNWPDLLSINLADNLCFKYEYDHRNRMVLKKVPGAEPVYMVYDKWDRLVLTQDGNLHIKEDWMYTKYDELNRPIYTGLYHSTLTPALMQGQLDASALIRYESPGTEVELQYTHSNSFPSLSIESLRLLTITYYDDYLFTAPLPEEYKSKTDDFDEYFYNASNESALYAQPLSSSLLTKGMVTGKVVYQLETGGSNGTGLHTVIFYDDKGRVLQTKSKNHSGGIDIATTQYNFAGQALRTVLSHQKKLASEIQHTIITATTLEYDGLSRLASVQKKIILKHTNGKTIGRAEKTIAKYQYNALGQLQAKKLGIIESEKYGNSLVETLNYDYNIRGWLTGINRNYLSGSGNNESYFGMELAYDKTTAADNTTAYAQPQLNGNIAGTMWRTKGDETSRMYDYAYDNVNRLLKAEFNQKDVGSNWGHGTVDFTVKMGDGVNYATAYDENGNILRMQQWGMLLNSSAQIDDLRYTYINSSNQLLNVVDKYSNPQSALGDFKTSQGHGNFANKETLRNTANPTPAQCQAITDYDYDENGNLMFDENKNIQTISYNLLNLPQIITLKNNKGKIEYLYDATGNKLSKTTTEYVLPTKTIVTTTTYIAGFVYESKTSWNEDENNPNYTDKLQFFPHEEGRVRYNSVTEEQLKDGIPPTFCFDYFVKDHLGNIRMVLTDEGKEDKYPPASLEENNIASERLLYNIPDNGSVQDRRLISGYPTNDERTDPNNYVQKLLAPETKVGTSIVLKVMSGDKFNVSASSWYKNPLHSTPGNSNHIIENLVAALAGGVSTAATAGGHALIPEQANYELLGPGLESFFNGPETHVFTDASRPKAHLNWVLVDEQFAFVAGGAEQVPEESVYGTGNTAQVYTHMLNDIPVTKNGYLYAYVSNETTNIPVFFDNLQVVHYRGTIFEETHYYPFGLVMAGISSKAAGITSNKKKFNGGNELQSEEFSDGSGLELLDAVNRLYDPQLGRFWQIDELAESNWEMNPYCFASNNPIRFNDPLGLSDNDPNKPVDLPVVVHKAVKKLNHNQLQSLYWSLRNRGISYSGVASPVLRARLERWDGIQRHMERVHQMTRESDIAFLNAASWLMPGAQITKLRYVTVVATLFKFKRGATVVGKATGKIATKYGESFTNELTKEIIANRGNLSEVDLHDVLTSTATDKVGTLAKVGANLYNSFVDVKANGIEAAGINKSNGNVGLDLMFSGLKSFLGTAAESSASEATQKGIDVMLDQGKKTISDVANQK